MIESGTDFSNPIAEFSLKSFPDFEVGYDKHLQTYWLSVRRNGSPRATLSFVEQLHTIQTYVSRVAQEPGNPPIRFCVTTSKIPGVFNFGGDLPFFVEQVRNQDRDALRRYAHACVEMIHANSTGWGTSAVSIALLQGDALGGGFESAISHNLVVAERSCKMGMPEILFNTFPGMGAFSFLSRRLDSVRVERMILSGKVYTAGEMYDAGLVDVLAEDGNGPAEVRRILGDERRYHILSSIQKVRNRINPVSLSEMHDVTDIWVENVLKLSSSDLRKMEKLVSAQTRRLAIHRPDSVQ